MRPRVSAEALSACLMTFVPHVLLSVSRRLFDFGSLISIYFVCLSFGCFRRRLFQFGFLFLLCPSGRSRPPSAWRLFPFSVRRPAVCRRRIIHK